MFCCEYGQEYFDYFLVHLKIVMKYYTTSMVPTGSRPDFQDTDQDFL